MPDLRDAIAMMKAGDQIGAQRLMNQIVGLPANTVHRNPSAGKMAGPAAKSMLPTARAPMTPPRGQGTLMGFDKRAKGGKIKAKGYASGGLTAGHKSADGVATKGKTKGKQVKMMGGGKC